ncbi:MAG: response regulator transcription factor [Acidobacteriota bacterium]
MKKILVIDDDQKLNELLADYLKKFDIEIISSTDPVKGLKIFKKLNPDLVILDVMMPEMDGFEVCRRIRANSSTPIIMLTARGEVSDRIVGLELGADDYLPKPFEPRELAARIQTILRRGRLDPNTDVKRLGDLSVNFRNHKVELDNNPVDLTSAEYEILKIFVNRPGIVFTRNQILEHLWEIEWDVYNRSVDVLISRLRQKLGDDPKAPRFIKTVWGTGYIFIGNE